MKLPQIAHCTLVTDDLIEVNINGSEVRVEVANDGAASSVYLIPEDALRLAKALKKAAKKASR